MSDVSTRKRFYMNFNLVSEADNQHTCLLYLFGYIWSNTVKGLFTGTVMPDHLQMAFDPVDHVMLCNKLKDINFTEESVEWYRSCLSDRKQYMLRYSMHKDMKLNNFEWFKSK